MATTGNSGVGSTMLRTFEVIRLKKAEIYSIYFFAAMYGLLQLSIPLGIQMIVNFIQAYTFSTSLWVLIGLVLLGVLFSGALQVTQMRIIERVNQKIFSRYAIEFAYRIPRFDMKGVDDYYLPELVNRFFDTVSVQKGLGKLLIDIPMASIQILFGIILLSLYSQVFILFGIVLLLVLTLIIYFTSKRGIETNEEESNYKYAVAGWLEEMARTFKTFKFSIDANIHLKHSDKLVSKYLDARTNHFKVLLSQYWALIGFKLLITGTMLIVGAILAVNNQLNIGQFVAAEIVIIMIMASVEKFIYSLDTVYDLFTSVDKLNKVLDKPLETDGVIPFESGNKGVEVKVKDLSFSFGDKNNVLKNVSFHIPAGSKVCIMGHEGAGKSILLRILTGAYNDYSGSVLLNDIPINNYNLRSLHQHTGMILNDQDIFNGTVLNNITLGNPDISLQNITKLAAITQFDQYVPKLKDGYNTILDVAGNRLSKSASNKILLMRALIHQPHLLLFENPWSGLSKDSRSRIEEYILNELVTTTVLVATNDVSFAVKCDQVIVMQEGTVRAIGKANEVLHFLN
ncbi:MAG: ATP-binding cassette protein [Segetibacter sp.]|jgi:ABC-type bacteriocin/lantibiotic exporter with double-glycine peptidase domain|nr:ATP-binding cassette protein [Segetibacter sp.]